MTDDQAILAAKREGYVKALVQHVMNESGKYPWDEEVDSFKAQSLRAFPDPYTPREVEYGGMRYRIDEAGLPQQSVGSMWVGFDIDITDVPLQLIVIFGDLAREYLAHREGEKA